MNFRDFCKFLVKFAQICIRMIWRKQFPESTFDFTYNRRELSAYEKRGCENFHRLNLQTDLAVEILGVETQETVFSWTPGCRDQ